MVSIWNRPILSTLLNKAEVHHLRDKPQCLKMRGQRPLTSLSITPRAILYKAHNLFPRVPSSMWVFRDRSWGLHIYPAPGTMAQTGSSRGTECWGRGQVCVQLPTSICKGAEMLGAQTALYTSRQSPPLGKESWQTALYVLQGATFMETRKEKQATPPEPSVHFPVCLLFRTKMLEQIYTSKCTQEVGQLNMSTRPTGCSVQGTKSSINPLNWMAKHCLHPMELPTPALLQSCTAARL